MRKSILPFLIGMVSALPVFAQCAPADIRDSLSDAERASIARAVAETPYGEGRAFQAVRGDQEIFLFGTFHSAQAGDIPAGVQAAMDGASQVLVEVTAEQNGLLQAQMQTDPALIMDMAGPGLEAELDPEDWQALVGALQPLGLPPEAADRLQPWFAGTMIALPMCELMQQAAGKMPIDTEIETMALDRGIPVAGLETAMEALEAFAQMSRETQIDFLEMSLVTVEQSEEVFSTTAVLYSEGRIAEIFELSNVLAEREIPAREVEAMGDAMLDPLLVQRNRNWMPAILASAGNGPTIVAVGALHLGGEDGLLRMLEAEGFEISRVVLDGEVAQ